jgi:uncharacterized protein (DUF1684 family)
MIKLFKYILPLLFIFFLSGCIKKTETDPAYASEISNWHNKRVQNLKKETGWLNIAGLYWLKQGENSFGSDRSNDIIFPSGAPSKIGSIILNDSVAQLKVNENIDLTINDNKVKESLLQNDLSGKPTIMSVGSYKWFIIRRGDKYGIRLRDLNSPAVKSFPGIETYPVDKSWKIEASYVKFPEPRKMMVPTIIGTVEENTVSGNVTFSKDGNKYSLVPIVEDDSYFFIFADETNGEETYGAGRFLYTTLPDSNGKVTLDFNKAYNPPCAFTKYATCPLPPKDNYLHIKLTAGEKKFVAGH